ncbi:MAG: histidine--tRNA ligase [Candidatus Nanoarchaeia archaeon]
MELEQAKGVKDTPPEEKIIKNEVIDRIRKIFELYGFLPLETSILERYETLAAKFAAGEASDALKEVFKLKDQGDRNLALRFDLTVPLSRYIAMNPNLKMPFKRYEVGPAFRDGPIKLGRTREFWQMDIDTVGSASMLADAEILAMVDAAFKELQLEVVIKTNNRKLLNGMLEQIGIKEKKEVITIVDKLDKIGQKGISEELLSKGYTQQQINQLFNFIKPGITIEELKNRITDKEGLEGIKELQEMFSYLNNMGITTVQFEPSLARGLAYYTGTVFEAYLKQGTIKSSLAGGGRYDDMIGKFLGEDRKIPAVGIAFGLVPIIETIKERNKITKKTFSKAYVIPIGTINEALTLTQNLRNKGISTDIDLVGRGVSKNLDYANALGIPFVVFVGEDEVKKKKYKLKDMTTGKEQFLTLSSLIKTLQK